MDPCSLQRFYGDPLRQNILRNGYDQLINFLRELEALWMTLTPEERVVVQPNGWMNWLYIWSDCVIKNYVLLQCQEPALLT